MLQIYYLQPEIEISFFQTCEYAKRIVACGPLMRPIAAAKTQIRLAQIFPAPARQASDRNGSRVSPQIAYGGKHERFPRPASARGPEPIGKAFVRRISGTARKIRAANFLQC